MSMTPALARRLGKAVTLLGSPVDGEVLAAVRAVGRTLEAAGMDWHALAALVTGETVRMTRPAFTFATLPPRTARKQMSFLAWRPGVSPAERARLELLRAKLLGARKLSLSGTEIEWLDALWRKLNSEPRK
jgi:hypothetical protein